LSAFIVWLTEHEVNVRFFASKLAWKMNFSTSS